jgi:hypothetical protein
MTVVAVACGAHDGAVDLLDDRYPHDDDRYPHDEVLHFSAAEWAEFLAEVKAGKFDSVAHPDGRETSKTAQPSP